MRERRGWLSGLAILILAVLVLYGLSYLGVRAGRKPAMAMGYMYYCENETLDAVVHYAYYPLYWLERDVFGSTIRHHREKEPPDPSTVAP